MSIDEAMALVKIERECVIRADVCDRKCEKCDLFQDSTELTDMYEHLAEWLEELKMYKSLAPRELVSEKQKNERLAEYSKGFDYGFKTGYNKAIGDFVKFASDMPTVETEDGEIRPMWLEEMAEQLKAGGNIELSEHSKSQGNRTGK